MRPVELLRQADYQLLGIIVANKRTQSLCELGNRLAARQALEEA